MSILLAIWHVIPGWSLGGLAGIAVGVAIASYLGFWPVIRGFIEVVVGMIPWKAWQTWALIGAAVAIFGFKVWLDLHDQALEVAAKAHEEEAVKQAVKVVKDAAQAREDAAHALYVAALANLKQQLAIAQADAVKRGKELAAELANDRVALAAAADELERERRKHVTAVANARCSLTRGVIVQFNAGAAVANGERAAPDDLAHADSAGSDDAPSGVSLDTYTAAVGQTHIILGQARRLIDRWKALRASDERAIADANKALANCIPKGTQ